MDGWQATEHIRLLERARGLRPGRGAAFIVAVTSEDVSHGSPALQKCWQCGMDAVMVSSRGSRPLPRPGWLAGPWRAGWGPGGTSALASPSCCRPARARGMPMLRLSPLMCACRIMQGKSVTLDNVAELLRLACTAAAGCPRDEGQAPARRSSLDCEPACLPGRLQQMLDGGVFVQ